MSHHRDKPNAVQRAFTERQKSLRIPVEMEPGYRPPPLCPDCGVDVSKVICIHFSNWLKESRDKVNKPQS